MLFAIVLLPVSVQCILLKVFKPAAVLPSEIIRPLPLMRPWFFFFLVRCVVGCQSAQRHRRVFRKSRARLSGRREFLLSNNLPPPLSRSSGIVFLPVVRGGGATVSLWVLFGAVESAQHPKVSGKTVGASWSTTCTDHYVHNARDAGGIR
ncbi:uncharacterized protein VDAG_05942 [Verticillium dahliae VdLs.17]|uniref:Uncharacterized protein n=1 Tax=Verticillium dahliae (strain VdLs.17 / ATCC MYA-4575 / FGSC 10137) TaxID=498257 RepID=G2X710_VERDV|nr:uncharacterized protein VDAG_05942 [Verticillium dahliae VdLs.17]EGY14778.1 hypothetical protein VDAG_05942 [Verticillium dahliae VdLs.17]KAH6708157.1 hypothetical protein EV126DRAFT_483886 [Verticillium dahliae]